MDPKLYSHIVSVIDNYRTWIRVVDDNCYISKYFIVGGVLVECCCKTLALVSYQVRWGVEKPRMFHITMAELSKGINTLSREEKGAKERVAKCELTLNDVESIVRTATNGVLKLGLGRYGFG